jgi:hypothetical protein
LVSLVWYNPWMSFHAGVIYFIKVKRPEIGVSPDNVDFWGNGDSELFLNRCYN